jgi:D-beta-D-heptose 7-phosphate kinase / D-beta-D-heptose 1-phosphate adenosyltransferase
MSDQELPQITPSNVLQQVEEWRQQGKKIVFASGVFDLLHQEHKLFLEKAKALGDVLVVSLESDVRVRQIKGEGRPINPQGLRKQNLEKLGIADVVFILPEDFAKPQQHRQIIAELRPDFMAVSSHTSHLDKKRLIVEEFGGQLLVVHEHNPAVSTTQLLAQRS